MALLEVGLIARRFVLQTRRLQTCSNQNLHRRSALHPVLVTRTSEKLEVGVHDELPNRITNLITTNDVEAVVNPREDP